VERCASPSLEMSNLGSMVLWGLCVGCGLVDLRRVEASSDIVVASMASLVRGSASVEHPGEGCAEREVEVISEGLAQGAFFRMYQGLGVGDDRGTRSGLILYALY
jgi:hypothetical protein